MGHKPPAIPDFRSARGGLTALRATGHDTLEALLDSMFQRVAPAAMLVGDLGLMDGEPPFDALVIGAGGKVFGYHEDAEGLAPIAEPIIKAAWRL